MDGSFIFSLGLGLAAVFSAIGALLLLTAFRGTPSGPQSSVFQSETRETVFMFDGETLVDCTAGARAILTSSRAPGGAWTKFLAYFAASFPNLAEQLKLLPAVGVITLSANDADGLPLLLMAEMRGGLMRITIQDAEHRRPGTSDPMSQRAMSEELGFLRGMISHAPMMIWQENEDEEIIWGNTAYVLAADKLLPVGKELTWPLPRIFEKPSEEKVGEEKRQRIEFPGQPPKWFDLSAHEEGPNRLVFAIPADSAVQAESSLRDFMQTLTKTFAHIPIGLAIFDKNRLLQLFNPAIIDLTGLQPDFLSQRPSLVMVLDAMRERQIMPEPKDYRGWRRHIVELERGASSGVHEEIWNLPSGQTYRLVGRPHPNGALALMFEDITGEVSRTRRYRADLELGQSVIDAMDEAVAVFSETGALVMTNTAYSTLWGHEPAETLHLGAFRSLADHWKANSAPTKLWDEIEDYLSTVGDRDVWSNDIRLLDGRLITCRMHPLTGGATLVGFQPELAEPVRLGLARTERKQA